MKQNKEIIQRNIPYFSNATYHHVVGEGAHSTVNTSSVNGIYKVVSTIFQLKSVVSTLNLGCKVRSTLVPSNINTILKSQVIPTAEIIEIRLG